MANGYRLSVVALASARKGLGQVVQQAQREIGKLATQPSSTPTSPRPSTSTSEPSKSETANTVVDTTGDVNAAASTSAETTSDSEDTNTTSISAERSTSATATSTSTTPSASNSLFSFLPTNIAQNLTSAPTNIQTTLQRTLATPEIQNLRSSISTSLTTLRPTVLFSISTAQSTIQSSVQSARSNPQVQHLASSVQNLPASAGNLYLSIGSFGRFVIEKRRGGGRGSGRALESFSERRLKIVPPSEEELVARERSMGGMGGMGMFENVGVWLFDDLGGDGGGGIDEEEEKGAGEGEREDPLLDPVFDWVLVWWFPASQRCSNDSAAIPTITSPRRRKSCGDVEAYCVYYHAVLYSSMPVHILETWN